MVTLIIPYVCKGVLSGCLTSIARPGKHPVILVATALSDLISGADSSFMDKAETVEWV